MKILRPCIAIFLVPCLLADPATAAVRFQFTPTTRYAWPATPLLFASQALAPVDDLTQTVIGNPADQSELRRAVASACPLRIGMPVSEKNARNSSDREPAEGSPFAMVKRLLKESVPVDFAALGKKGHPASMILPDIRDLLFLGEEGIPLVHIPNRHEVRGSGKWLVAISKETRAASTEILTILRTLKHARPTRDELLAIRPAIQSALRNAQHHPASAAAAVENRYVRALRKLSEMDPSGYRMLIRYGIQGNSVNGGWTDLFEDYRQALMTLRSILHLNEYQDMGEVLKILRANPAWIQAAPAPTSNSVTPTPDIFPDMSGVIFNSLGVRDLTINHSVTNGPYVQSATPFRLGENGRSLFTELFGLRVDVDAILLDIRLPGHRHALSQSLILTLKSLNMAFLFDFGEADRRPSSQKPFDFVTPARVLAAGMMPACRGNFSDIVRVQRIETPYGIRLLTLKRLRQTAENILFDAEHASSIDYQEVLASRRDLFEGKRIREWGYGTGVSFVHGLRFGAIDQEGTEISHTYAMLTKWNMEFVRMSGQIRLNRSVPLDLFHARRLDPMSPGDLYLINAPALRAKEEIEQMQQLGVSKLFIEGVAMSVDAFRVLMAQLKQRLSETSARAVIRVLPSVLSDLVRLPIEDLSALDASDGDKIEQHHRQAMAHAFLRSMGFVFEELAGFNKKGAYQGIFLIFAPTDQTIRVRDAA